MIENRPFGVKLIHCGNINPANPIDKEEKNLFFMPMGLPALADLLKQMGVDVEIIHSDLEQGHRIEDIVNFDTLDAVGFDCHWINQALVVLNTAALIKRIKPGVFIFLGGFSASLFAEEIVSTYRQVDAVIRGDAEIPLQELCRALRGEIPVEKVQNLVWKDREEHVHANPFTYTITAEEMDKLDFTAFHLVRNFDFYKYTSKYWTTFPQMSDSQMFLLEVGRGCQFACTFCGGNCDAQYRINKRKKTIARSVDSVIGTIKKAVSAGFNTFYTCLEWDDSQEWYIQLFNRVRQENLKINYAYGCWGLPSKSLIDSLSDNFKNAIIEISPETGNIELRKKNKDIRIYYTNEQLEQTLDYAEKKGNVKIHLYFGYYLAGDTKETILETFAYILHLISKYPNLLIAAFSNFSTDPGSLLFFYPERYDIEVSVRNFSDYVCYLKKNYQEKQVLMADLTLFKPKNISGKDDIEIRQRVRLLHNLFSFYSKSVSYILKKRDGLNTVLSFLKEVDITADANHAFTQEEVKEKLINHCQRANILDESLLQSIHSLDKKFKPYQQSILSNPRLGMDYEEGEKNLEENGLMVNLPISNTRVEEEKLHSIEFDI